MLLRLPATRRMPKMVFNPHGRVFNVLPEAGGRDYINTIDTEFFGDHHFC